MYYNWRLWVFPCIIMLSFIGYWIVFLPILWHFCFKTSVNKHWPDYWHYIFWFTAFIIWAVLMILFLIFWMKRHKKGLEKKSEIIKSIVQRKVDYQSGLEMKTFVRKPIDCNDSTCLNGSDQSKFSGVKQYYSVHDTNTDLVVQSDSKKALRVLGYVCDADIERWSSGAMDVDHPCGKSQGDVNKRKSYDDPSSFKIENEKCQFPKKRNTFHEATSDFSKNILPFAAPKSVSSERIFSRDSLFAKSLKTKKDIGFSGKKSKMLSDNHLTKPLSEEIDQNLQKEKVIFHKVSFKKSVKNARNENTQPDTSNNNQPSESVSHKFSEQCVESEMEKSSHRNENITLEENEDIQPNTSNLSESPSPRHSTQSFSREDSYKGLPKIESFDTYLKLVTVDTPTSPRNSFFSDLIEAANTIKSENILSAREESPTPEASPTPDVFSELDSPTREYFVADVRPRLPSVKTEAFIIIDNTAETNKRASKSFLLIENNSGN